MNKLLVLVSLCLPAVLWAQETRKISGQVLEAASGHPLPGATVFIDPESPEAKVCHPAGTVADVNGHFELVLPVSVHHVVVSFIGFEALRADVSGKTEFVFRLKEELKQLDEVVVTGYQNLDRRKVTSAVITVKTDEIRRIGVPTIDQMLEGQAAGVTVTPTNGAPGAPAKMRIRSTVTLSGSTDPLWVMDGMILEGNDIPKDFTDKDNLDNLYNTSIAGVNPADIESITILKDAAATAIYGARAANGVIVITTKKGRQGKMRVSAAASVFVTVRPDLDKLDLMNASEKVDWELQVAAQPELDRMEDENGSQGAVRRLLEQYGQLNGFRENGLNGISAEVRERIEKLRTSGADWGKEIYRNAVNRQYTVSVAGGSDAANYYASVGYYSEKGTTVGTGFERFNATLKTDLRLHDKVKLGVSLFVNHNKQESYLTDGDAFINPSRYSRKVNPYLDVFDADGNYLYDSDIQGTDVYLQNFNFREERENTDYTLNTLSLKPMLTLNFRPVAGLDLSTQFGMQLERSSTEKSADQHTYFVRKYRLKTRYNEQGEDKFFLPEGGIIQNMGNDLNQYHWKIQAEYARTLAGRHDLDVMAGTEMRGDKTVRISTRGFGYDAKALTTKPLVFPVGYATNDSNFEQYKKEIYENRYQSYFMTASYTYDNRYTLFGSLRYDGSNLFGVARKYKYLPLWAVSGAWNIEREHFMQGAEGLTRLKLRASYGIQGNVDKNTSPFILGTWGNQSILPGSYEPSITVGTPPNQNLRWEKTSNWNVGLDAGLLNDRITFSIDGYYRVSDDLIGTRTLPLENGFDYTSMNWAKLTNKGFEFALSTVNVRTRHFRWLTDFNIAHNKSKVNKVLVRDNDRLPSIQGYSVGAQFSIRTAGVDENGYPMYWKNGQKVPMADFFQLTPMFPFYSYYTSPLTDDTEAYRELFQYEGTTEPKFTGGLVNRFYYKNFDLTVSASFVLEQTVKEEPFYSPTGWYAGQNGVRRMKKVWSPENPNGEYQRLLGINNGEGDMYMAYSWFDDELGRLAYQHYDIWYRKMSYLRVNSIRMGYTLGGNLTGKLGLASARVSLEARNPFVFGSSYQGYFDPETFGSVYSQPMPKTFSCGLELTF